MTPSPTATCLPNAEGTNLSPSAKSREAGREPTWLHTVCSSKVNTSTQPAAAKTAVEPYAATLTGGGVAGLQSPRAQLGPTFTTFAAPRRGNNGGPRPTRGPCQSNCRKHTRKAGKQKRDMAARQQGGQKDILLHCLIENTLAHLEEGSRAA
jgi:hypothetical protein